MKDWKAGASMLLIGFLAGVGTMQATLVGDVRDNTSSIANNRHIHDKDTALMERRMDNIVKLWEANLEQQRANIEQQAKLISLVEQVIIQNRRPPPPKL